jgi:hypothetical protein
LEVNPLEKNTIPQDTHNNVEQFYKKGLRGNSVQDFILKVYFTIMGLEERG